MKNELKNADNKNKITNGDLYFFEQEIIGIITGLSQAHCSELPHAKAVRLSCIVTSKCLNRKNLESISKQSKNRGGKMNEKLAKIIMGSERDFDFCKKIGVVLELFKIPHEYRVASAHKTPNKVLEIMNEDKEDVNLVYITVAGRSNALSGFIDANTYRPVIACPPYSDKFAGADIFSSLRMPSGSGLATVLEPEAAAILAAKILAIGDKELAQQIEDYQKELKEKIYNADKAVRSHGQR
ncbi:MAG: 5-(carboxyamino)imidazole ribonucleotide mutase [Promethearchaeota archaeon]